MGRLSFLTIYRQNVSILGLPIDNEQLVFNKDRFKNKTKLMKTIRQAIIGAVALSFASATHTFAIEGLKISVQSSNAILSWPSTNAETYIVQYRPTLTPDSSWQTLTDYLAAATSTNVTQFVHSNIVQYPLASSGGGGGNISLLAPSEMSDVSSALISTSIAKPAMLVAIPANGSGGAVPLAIYPPGFDLSGFTIFDPVTGESVSGNCYSVSPSLMSSAQDGEIQPLDASGNDINSTPNTGFYRVVRDGVHIYSLTNGAVLSGTMQFPIEFALGSTDQIVGVTFYDENNSPIIGASAQGSGNYWTLTWNTPMAFNGNYNMYAEIDYVTDTPVVSVPVTVTVSNVISFPNYFSRVFGNQMWIYAQTIPNAAYQIDMYDENTNYFGSFVDYADGGGYISFLWDLTDGNGYTFDSTNFYGVFTVDTSSLSSMSQSMSAKNINASSPNFQTSSPIQKKLGSRMRANGASPNAGSSSASANQLWVKEPTWQHGNSWAIAYSPLDPNDSVSTLRISEMMIGGDGGAYGGVVSTLGFYGLGFPMSPGNVSQSSAFEMADANSRAQFLGYLAGNYRHCYFFGHGSPTAFGTQGAVITASDLINTLLNVPLSWQIQHAALHPYRFVFIDGCSAGSGNLCEAFGIPAITVNANFFATAGVESRAFLGFKTTKSFDPSQWTWRALMLETFFNDWAGGASVQQCVNDAGQAPFQPLPSSWVIFGATDLTRNIHTGP